jgi:MATE family multidrug resistance protein
VLQEENQYQNMSLNSPLIFEETKQNNKEEERRELVEEVKKQLWLSGPLISVTLLNFGINLISVMFVGHLGELSLSGASMATSFASVTGFSLLVSFSQTCSVHHHY